jgi:hypothetical protein
VLVNRKIELAWIFFVLRLVVFLLKISSTNDETIINVRAFLNLLLLRDERDETL